MMKARNKIYCNPQWKFLQYPIFPLPKYPNSPIVNEAKLCKNHHRMVVFKA